MKAIAAREGESAPRVIDRPRPDPAPGEALVRTLRVGVDGTDHEVIAGSHGGPPPGADHLVLGHEAVGVVTDPNDTALRQGDIVVPTVRRPPNGTNEYFEREEPDMAPAGAYHECGIDGAHGFMAEYFAAPEEFLIPVPESLSGTGFLIEPLSIAEKGLEHAAASRSAFEWSPESAIVLGNGSLGLLTLARLARAADVADGPHRYDRLYCLGRRDRPDPTIELIEDLGATYVDSRETPVDEIPESYEPMDFVFEATGHAPHMFRAIDALAPNGVAAVMGVPDSQVFEIDGGALHEELVLHNKALVGSVNSNRRHFERAQKAVDALPDWFLDRLVTGVYDVDAFTRAFVDDDSTIKTAVEFGRQ